MVVPHPRSSKSTMKTKMCEDEKLRKMTKPFGAFKKNVSGVEDTEMDEVKKHFLRGAWSDGTLKSYNSGIVKLYRFAEVNKIERSKLLPISPRTLKLFVVWASKKNVSVAREDESVQSTTLKAYIAGIKAWHMFHDEHYPHGENEAVKTLLKASRIVESKAQQVEKKRPPVMIADLVVLLEELPGRGEKGLAVLCAALIAFWGTARLGELLSDSPAKTLPTWSDLEWASDRSSVKIKLLYAKTAKPGETQHLYLHRQESLLDPVSILEEWHAFRPRKPNEELFTIKMVDRVRRLGKQETIDNLRSTWNERKPKTKQLLHGHSFRIGGASLRWNLGATREEVKESGRWQSDAYLIYLRKYSEKELKETRKLLHAMKWRPTKRLTAETEQDG